MKVQFSHIPGSKIKQLYISKEGEEVCPGCGCTCPCECTNCEECSSTQDH